MRKVTHYILYILIAFAALLNIQCSGNGKEKTPLPELVHAESVMFDHPDSALHILEDMPMPSARWDKENHALWCLLVTQAQVKLIMKISSDSLVRIAYDYYKPTDNARRKAMAALYMGDINYNLGNIEEAMQYYLEGKTEVEKTNDYKVGYLIMSSLGKLYLYRDFEEYAFDACSKAYDYAVKDSNKRYQMGSLQYLARCYCLLDKLPAAIETYQKCMEIALELGLENDEYYYGVQHETALVYTNSCEYEKSLSILRPFPVKYRSNSLIGKNLFSLGKLDSAFYYLNKALNTDNVYTKESVYRYLYRLCDNSKYRQYLKTYCDSLLYYNDSIIALDKGKEIIAYKEKYDHQKLITEQQRLKLEKADAQRMMFIITICLIVVTAIVAYLYQRRLVRKETTIRKQSEKLQEYMLQLHEYETRLMQNNRYMEELQEQISRQEVNSEDIESYREQIDSLQVENGRLSEKINSLQHHINDYSSKLDKARREADKFRNLSEENLYLKQRERVLADYVVDNDRLVKELRERCRILKDREWETLEQMCESTYSNFVSRLQGVCPTLTKQELHLCLLIKLRFNNTQMSEIFGVNTTSVSQKKFRLKKHLSDTLQDGLPDEMTLDRWVAEF
jgi:tetratricopeptide (TPR) repeat protein